MEESLDKVKQLVNTEGEKNMGDHEGNIVFIEFDQDNRPYQVMTHESHAHGVTCHDYDFAYSKKYGELLYHYTGMGPAESIELTDGFMVDEQGNQIPVDTIYWVAPGIEIKESPRSKRLENLPEPYTLENLFRDATNCHYGIVWCAECEDSMPDDEYQFCEHVWYCKVCEELSTPDDRCEHSEGAEAEEDEEIEV